VRYQRLAPQNEWSRQRFAHGKGAFTACAISCREPLSGTLRIAAAVRAYRARSRTLCDFLARPHSLGRKIAFPRFRSQLFLEQQLALIGVFLLEAAILKNSQHPVIIARGLGNH
jgi:hypothetical protein